MADTSKAQKLKSSKKRYKELLQEQRKKKNAVQNSENADADLVNLGQTPVDSLTSSTHSSVTTEQVQETVHQENCENNTPLPNYFGSTTYNNTYQPPAVFFDSLCQGNQSERVADNSFPTATVDNAFTAYFNPPNHNHIDNKERYEGQASLDPTQFGLNSINPESIAASDSPAVLENTDRDVVCMDDPEIKQNELFEMHRNRGIPEQDARDLLNYLQGAQVSETAPNLLEETAEASHVEEIMQRQNIPPIQPNEEEVSPNSSDLEKRNLELVSQLQYETQKSQQFFTALTDYETKVAQLEAALREKEVATDLAATQEITRLKEQLQCHTQTIEMLFSEKSELSTNLNQFELTSKQKSTECEELQARLKTSRSRVADLEREINSLKNERTKFDYMGREHFELFEQLKVDYKTMKDQNEELSQDLLEVREKLRQSLETNMSLQQLSHDYSSKLSMANVKIQQLTSGNSSQGDDQIEKITQEKVELEKQMSSLNQTIKSITKERDEFSSQYQQYVQQLNAQITTLTEKIEQLQCENENLHMQEKNRIKHIGDLERQLQSLQNEHINYTPQKNNTEALKNDIEASKELCVQLQMEKTVLEENHTKVCNERDMLLVELQGKTDSINQLESLVEQLRGNQPDSVKLLATMESDKVAAARAVAQNKDLKQQMEGMQEVFMKLNNDKVELTERLSSEHRTNKELLEKLQKTELNLQTLADAIEIKDRELSHLRDNSEELNKQVLHQGQLTDRLRHYEAKDHSSHSLQSELQEAKQTIVALSSEINQLKQTTSNGEVSATDGCSEQNGLDDNKEVNELKQHLQSLRIKNHDLELKLSHLNHTTDGVGTETDNNHNDEMHALDREVAMKHLEDKVKRTMQDIADLTEEKQRLEHLVLQLQGETETIGEYVALYQHQRSILKQKALEKDQQLKQLANDREQMKNKLQKLNELITKLVVEKGSVPSELLQHQQNMNRHSGDLCDEHSKLHKEINEITENKLGNLQEENNSSETAEQIIALLSEIKTSNLVQPSEVVHHCPWCSGQLLTV